MNGMKIEWDYLILQIKDVSKEWSKAYIKNVDERLVAYCRAFAKQIKPLPPKPQLLDLYHPSENQKNVDLIFVTVGSFLVTYDL